MSRRSSDSDLVSGMSGEGGGVDLKFLEALNLILPLIASSRHEITSSRSQESGGDQAAQRPRNLVDETNDTRRSGSILPRPASQESAGNNRQAPSSDTADAFPSDGPVLRGYQTLQELRQKTAEFRQGYLNWRKFKPQGARGETSDVFTQRKSVLAGNTAELESLKKLAKAHYEEEVHTAFSSVFLQPLGSSSAIAPSDVVTMTSPRLPSVGTGVPISGTATSLTVGAPSGAMASTALSSGGATASSAVEKDFIIQTAPSLGIAVGVPKPVQEEDQWLRFYYNPFTPAEEPEARPLCEIALGPMSELSLTHRQRVQIPPYSRDPLRVTDWIIHLGVGGFHRSHQLEYLDDILTLQFEQRRKAIDSAAPKYGPNTPANASTCLDRLDSVSSAGSSAPLSSRHLSQVWGYCGVGLTTFDARMATALRNQDLLYTILSRSNSRSSARVIGSMMSYVLAQSEPQRAYECLLNPRLRIVSLTVTEKGYHQDVHGDLDTSNPAVKHDVELLRSVINLKLTEQQSSSVCPSTAPGFLYWGIYLRRKHNLPMYTVMSCDNLPENGSVARNMVVQFAKAAKDKEEADWISENVSFPSTMVDRITPTTLEEHREILAKDFGILDEWPVVAEDFKQWFIEDSFPSGRPPWDVVGAHLVRDVRPFELMKLRLLNGGHSMIAYMGQLAGYSFIDDAVNDVRVSSFLRTYMDEVTSTIKNVSIELERYKEKIVERFGNRLIKDTLGRIGEDGSIKFYSTTKDALMELIDESKHVHCSSLGIAAWIVYLASPPPGSTVRDSRARVLVPLAKTICEEAAATSPSGSNKLMLLTSKFLVNVFGPELGKSTKLVINVSLAVFALKYKSTAAILARGGVLEALFAEHLLTSDGMQRVIDFARTH